MFAETKHRHISITVLKKKFAIPVELFFADVSKRRKYPSLLCAIVILSDPELVKSDLKLDQFAGKYQINAQTKIFSAL